jgi:hypothetical protein
VPTWEREPARQRTCRTHGRIWPPALLPTCTRRTRWIERRRTHCRICYPADCPSHRPRTSAPDDDDTQRAHTGRIIPLPGHHRDHKSTSDWPSCQLIARRTSPPYHPAVMHHSRLSADLRPRPDPARCSLSTAIARFWALAAGRSPSLRSSTFPPVDWRSITDVARHGFYVCEVAELPELLCGTGVLEKGVICGESIELAGAEAVDCEAYMANELGQTRFLVRTPLQLLVQPVAPISPTHIEPSSDRLRACAR